MGANPWARKLIVFAHSFEVIEDSMFRLSLDALQVIEAIARRGSFAAAADEVHRTTSTLSYTVRKLEDDLGVQLFDRSGHRARLTEAGSLLLEEGRSLLDQANALERRLRAQGGGWEAQLRVCLNELFPSVTALAAIQDFYKAGHPSRLRIDRAVLGGAWEALISRQADVAVCALPRGRLPDLMHAPVAGIDFVFAVAPGHPLASAEQPLRPAEIRKHRVVMAADASRLNPPDSTGITGASDVLTVGSLAAKFEAQLAGLGVGFLPVHLAAPAVAEGRLLECVVSSPKPRVELSVACHVDAGPAARWLFDRLRQAWPA